MAYYIDTNDFTTATAVWTNSILTTKSPDGYYSFGGNYRQQIDGFLTDLISCSNIDTVSITAIEETTATFNGNLISNGGDISATRGFVYGTSPNPTTANNVLTDTAVGQGLYSLNATGLTSETVYYVKAYAIVFGSTIYGDELNFETQAVPLLKEFLISNLSDPTDACGLLLPNTVYVSNSNTVGADTTATSISIVYTDIAGTITFTGDGDYYALFCNDLSNTVTTNQIITSVGTITGLIGICPP
jgi:hypothetical protein